MKFLKCVLILFTLVGGPLLKAQSFPAVWEGKWVGTVEIWSQNAQTDAFPMSLEILPEDTTWSFTINYHRNQNQPDVRKYSLLTVSDSSRPLRH